MIADPTSPPDPFAGHPELLERYRALRALVDAAAPPVHALLVVGVDRDAAEPAALLAIAFARAGRSTALVDADLRGGGERSPARRLIAPTAPPAPGLAEWLAGPAPSADAPPVPVVATRVERLGLVPAGTPRPAAGDLIGGERVGDLVPALRHSHERVIVAAPPLSNAADALPLARHVDAVLLVVAPGKTTGPAAARARDALAAAGGRILGVVLSD